MRRIGVILAGAALALALVSPAIAGATEKSSSGTTITAQGVRGGHGHGRHGFSHGFSRHDHGRFFRHAGCWGCGYPYWFYGYPYGYWYYGYPYGYYRGGFGCNFDYPCGPPYSDSAPPSARSGGQAPPAQCQPARPQPAQPAQQAQPAQRMQPAPSQCQQPPADQGMGPGPDQGPQPGPAQGQQPGPAEGQQAGSPGPAGSGQY
jgi:hypothetical protein